MKNVLFIHQNYPAQYVHLSKLMGKSGKYSAHALGQKHSCSIPGVNYSKYQFTRSPLISKDPNFCEQEAKFIRGEGVARACDQLKKVGFKPDVICAHPGWGEALFLRDVFPKTPIILYLEFYYRLEGLDVGFETEFTNLGGDVISQGARIRIKNYHLLSSMESMTCGISPTKFQASTFPDDYSGKINVIFDGVDTKNVVADQAAKFEIPGTKKIIRKGDKVVTFVNRNLEPYRGYHQFMRSLPTILKQVPDAEVLIVGGDDVSYGFRPTDGVSYKKKFFNEVSDKIDTNRVHFLGWLPYERYLKVLQVSMAHVYLTYPFVLGWSMIEAMSMGCTIIGSSTAPVMEALRDGENGMLVSFFEPEEIAEGVVKVLNEPEKYRHLGETARTDAIREYDLNGVCLPKLLNLIDNV